MIASSRIASAFGCPLQQKFNCHVRHSHTTRLSHVESSHLLGKNYESLLSRVRLLVCFQWLAWQFACLISMWNMNNIHFMGENILPPQTSSKPGHVPFLSGEMVPVSGIWRPDHSRCPSFGDIWLRKQTPFPACSGCGSSAEFALIEEILHISEDPDFQ